MNIYFSGLGGVGIGPLVDIALDAGFTVQGSDMQSSPTVKHLEQRGVMLSIGVQNGQFLKECQAARAIDLFVYTAALPADHPELLEAKNLGIRAVNRYEFLADVIKNHNLQLIAVSGTHGKTTTTGMIIWAMQRLGIPLSYAIGTSISFGPAGRLDPKSRYFVLECDEYEKHLLQFSPSVSVIPSIDYDHPDTYPDRQDYIETFRQFIAQSGHSILWRKDAEYIGVSSPALWALEDDEVADIPLAGAHYRRNATLALKTLEYLKLGSTLENIANLSEFPGTGRRFEKLADNLYSDYGHHPTEIAAMLELTSELSNHVVLVYQPHQNRRQHEIKDDYRDQFETAEKVYWLPTYLSREDPHQAILTPQELTKYITNTDIVFAELDDDLWQEITAARKSGKLVLVMGAGDIDSWVREKLTSE
jgi:UDP-N-acetylmuramate--alanine ligase